jgi:rhamnose utilization protein RhaD (predicted bifunctional aldolase and dehydrogenase)
VREAITAASKHLRERLEDLWNADDADSVAGDPLGLLRYRSNLLGADLRITNFGGGNTSSKFESPSA